MNIARSFSALAIAAAIAAPLAASAQTAPAPATAAASPAAMAGNHHHQRWMRAMRSVNLTADQKTKIKGFIADAKTANQNADPATKKANHAKLRANIEGILTPEQMTQYRAALAAQPSPAPK